MSDASRESHLAKITSADMARFHQLAEKTLQRTNSAYIADEMARSLNWAWIGLVPVVGLLWFDWQAGDWLLYLLVGAWSGIILDVFKLYFLNDQIMKTADAAYEDNFVWTIVDSLREGKKTAPRDHLRASYAPKMGIFVDIVFGGIGTLLTSVMFPGDLLAASNKSTLFWPLVAMLLYRVALTAWEIIEQRSAGTEDRTVRVAVGLRGVGLFLLGFLVGMIVGDEEKPNFSAEQTAWWAMLIVNALAIVAGALNIWGMLMIRSNAKWLRGYLEKRGR